MAKMLRYNGLILVRKPGNYFPYFIIERLYEYDKNSIFFGPSGYGEYAYIKKPL